MDWDNFRYFLELSRAGRLTTAARRLGVDHTTVSRRIKALEKSMDSQLFIRDTTGYRLTEAGQALLPSVETMEDAGLRIEASLPNQVERLSGTVRIGVTEGYGNVIVARNLHALTERYPFLSLDLLALPRAVRLSRHEADIVITLERPQRGPFVMTKLTDYTLKLYGSKTQFGQSNAIRNREQLAQYRFVSYVDDLVFSNELKFLDEVIGSGEVSIRSTSVLAQQELIASGAGIGILPSFSADPDPRLVSLLPEEIAFTRTFWMVMPEDLRSVARVRVVWDHLREVVDVSQSLLAGEGS
ncbi:LysR family transcriptional regulator [Marinobacter salarius]|uniref:LysR family transcriptional regulator n=1 Tax=Marinobacter salarius TaxID=1420917 RepID=UPI00273BAEA3|nr:LysR family transcriptional regulator [Marinobacter salarius]MDP4534319.1 LysR family transcriptional regulator [Marinobacter salarius]